LHFDDIIPCILFILSIYRNNMLKNIRVTALYILLYWCILFATQASDKNNTEEVEWWGYFDNISYDSAFTMGWKCKISTPTKILAVVLDAWSIHTWDPLFPIWSDGQGCDDIQKIYVFLESSTWYMWKTNIHTFTLSDAMCSPRIPRWSGAWVKQLLLQSWTVNKFLEKRMFVWGHQYIDTSLFLPGYILPEDIVLGKNYEIFPTQNISKTSLPKISLSHLTECEPNIRFKK